MTIEHLIQPPEDLRPIHRRRKCPVPFENLRIAFRRQGNFTLCLGSNYNLSDLYYGIAKRNPGADEDNEDVGRKVAFSAMCRLLRAHPPEPAVRASMKKKATRKATGKRCGVCDEKHYARGLCKSHYQKMWRSGKEKA